MTKRGALIGHWPKGRKLSKQQVEEIHRMRKLTVKDSDLSSDEARQDIYRQCVDQVEPMYATDHLQPSHGFIGDLPAGPDDCMMSVDDYYDSIEFSYQNL